MSLTNSEQRVQRGRIDDETAPRPLRYHSTILRYLMEWLGGRPEARLLDAGPVYNHNIQVLATEVKSLAVGDLFLSLDRDRGSGISYHRYWQLLDYPAETFDGILLWNLIDRLNEAEAGNLVDRCHHMARPGGLVMLLSTGPKVSPTGQDTFLIGPDFELISHGTPYPHMPARQRQNREILQLLAPFSQYKSIVYRNGIREFLVQREG